MSKSIPVEASLTPTVGQYFKQYTDYIHTPRNYKMVYYDALLKHFKRKLVLVDIQTLTKLQNIYMTLN